MRSLHLSYTDSQNFKIYPERDGQADIYKSFKTKKICLNAIIKDFSIHYHLYAIDFSVTSHKWEQNKCGEDLSGSVDTT